MLRLKNILVPRDFSPCSEQAMQRAFAFARRTGATVHLLFVEVLYADVPTESSKTPGASHASLEQRLLDEVPADLAETVPVVTVVERDIAAAPAIIAYAEAHEIDLIVMGTHGRRGLRRLLLGSAAEEVVRTSPCPVLTVRGTEATEEETEPAEEPEGPPSILVPLDFSRHGTLALAHARELAALFEARLDLLHVVEDHLHPAFYNTGVMTIYDIDPDIDQKSLDELKKAYEKGTGPDVPVAFYVRDGQAARQIVAFAKETDALFIVMPTHGLRGLEHFLLGSVAEKVVRRASCPVFTIKSFGKHLLTEPEVVSTAEQDIPAV